MSLVFATGDEHTLTHVIHALLSKCQQGHRLETNQLGCKKLNVFSDNFQKNICFTKCPTKCRYVTNVRTVRAHTQPDLHILYTVVIRCLREPFEDTEDNVLNVNTAFYIPCTCRWICLMVI